MNRASKLVVAALFCVLTTKNFALAGGLPVADVWVSVSVTPNVFLPMGTGVIELTMHNNGPDAAGTDYPGSLGNLIAQRAFLLTAPSQLPPYRVLPDVSGCDVSGEVVGPNVNMLWGFIWSFSFPPVPAGGSRTCRIPIQFFSQPFESFDTNWRISTNPEDPDLTNNTVSYRFIAGTPSAVATPVPALDRWAVAVAILCLLALSLGAVRRRASL